MAENMTILVGTSGQGVLRSADGGDTWRRAAIDQGLHSDAVVRCLAVHPDKPNQIYAGSDKGLYNSDDAGATWKLLQNTLNSYTVWALVIDAEDPNLMYAGAKPQWGSSEFVRGLESLVVSTEVAEELKVA